MAEAKTMVDGSQFIMNEHCLSGNVTRWSIRTAYGIQGDNMSDCCLTVFCPCCATNQMFQEANRRGMPAREFAGYHNNLGNRATEMKCEMKSCCYACCCGPCAIGTGLERALGLNWWVGCCCVNSCMAHQLMRYQYRIKGNDMCDDYIVPLSVIYLGYVLSGFTCGASYALIFPYSVGRIVHLLQESEARSNGVPTGSGRYLFDTVPAAGVAYAAAGAPPGEPKY